MEKRNNKPSLDDITTKIFDFNSELFIDNLLDLWEAMVNDASFKSIKNSLYFDSFFSKYSSIFGLIRKSRINMEDFISLKVIGRGAFGEIHLVKSKLNNQVYAMKQLNKYNMLKKSDTAFFWEERSVMLESNSVWIVRLHYSFQDRKNLYLILDFMAGGDFVTLISNYDISEKWAQFYVAEIILAINALHELGYLHRDIKPDNILLDVNGHVKLADFGTCMKMDSNKKVRTDVAVGTPDYISPEVLKCQGKMTVCGPECDFWSVGVLLYELLSGETPFYADSLAVTYGKIMDFKNSLMFPDEPEFSFEAKSLIKSFLTDANSRLGSRGIEEIKKHPFFIQDLWTWDNIRQTVAPVIPDLKSEDDSSNFDDFSTENESTNTFQSTKNFMGNNLPFVGFTYSGEYKPLNLSNGSLHCDDDLQKINPAINLSSTKIEELENLIKSYKEQISTLETQNSRCQILQKKIEDELTIKMEYNQVLMNQNVSYNLQIEELNHKNNELLSLYEESENIRQNIQQQLFQYEKGLLTIEKDEIINLKSKLSNSNDKCQAAYEEISSLNTCINQFQLKERQLIDSIDKLQSLLEQTKNNSVLLTKEKTSLENELTESHNLLEKLNENLQLSTKKFDEQSILIRNLTFENDESKQQITQFVGEVFLLKDQLFHSNKLRIEMELLYSDMKTKMKLDSGCHEKIDEQSEISIKYKEICANYELLKNRYDQLDADLKSYIKKNETLNNSLNEESIRFVQLQKELNGSTSVIASLNAMDRCRIKDIKELSDNKTFLEDQLNSLRKNNTNSNIIIKDLNEKLINEQYSTKIYQKQCKDLKTEINLNNKKLSSIETDYIALKEEKTACEKSLKCLESEYKIINNNLTSLQNELNKERNYKAFIELQLKEASNFANSNTNVRDLEISDLKNQIETVTNNLQSLMINENNLKSELNQQISLKSVAMETLKKQLEIEKTMKNQAVFKLAEIMQRKTIPTSENKKQNNIKENKENRRLQLQLKQEKEKFDQSIGNYQTQIHELSMQLIEANQQLHKLQCEINTKDETIVNLQSKLTISISNIDHNLEGWLSVLRKPSNRRNPWVKRYFKCVDFPTKRILIFENETLVNSHKPSQYIDLGNIYHIRPVTQGDIIRALPEEIPLIFQILYSDDIEIKTDNFSLKTDHENTDSFININGHKFINIQYHTPTNCEACNKSLWHLFRPQPALECQQCRIKIHKDHISNKEDDLIDACKVAIANQLAKELLVLSNSSQEQLKWIDCIHKQITGNLPRTNSLIKLKRNKTNEKICSVGNSSGYLGSENLSRNSSKNSKKESISGNVDSPK